MKKVATGAIMVGLVLLGFPVTHVLVWACALLGAYQISGYLTDLIWFGLVNKRYEKGAKLNTAGEEA